MTSPCFKRCLHFLKFSLLKKIKFPLGYLLLKQTVGNHFPVSHIIPQGCGSISRLRAAPAFASLSGKASLTWSGFAASHQSPAGWCPWKLQLQLSNQTDHFLGCWFQPRNRLLHCCLNFLKCLKTALLPSLAGDFLPLQRQCFELPGDLSPWEAFSSPNQT